MLICKYTRMGNAAYVPHLDTLRAVEMGMRRCGIQAEYSEGFHPHLKIFFGQPLPIGTESECEYFCVYTDTSAQTFRTAMNSSLPQGLTIVKAGEVERDPNVAKIMCFADYIVTMRDEVPCIQEMEALLSADRVPIEYTAKGERVQKDVKSLIEDFRFADNRTLTLRLCCGNRNLRADRLAAWLCDRCGVTGYEVRKTHTYDGEGTDLDKILFGRGH